MPLDETSLEEQYDIMPQLSARKCRALDSASETSGILLENIWKARTQYDQDLA